MITSATIYKYNCEIGEITADLFATHEFVPCQPNEELSVGFIPPREEHGAMIEFSGAHAIARVAIEMKTVPASEIDKLVKIASAKILDETGRKPGKKETKELREDARRTLMPHMIPRLRCTTIWFNKEAKTLVIDSASNGVVDAVINLLLITIPDINLSMLRTTVSPASAMTQWLLAVEPDDMPANILIGRSCKLKSSDEEKSVVNFQRHNLGTPEVRKHIQEGKLPVSLALQWGDRATFAMDDRMRLTKIEYMGDVLIERADSEETNAFDANVLIMTAEVSALIAGLVEAMGGEFVPKEEEGAGE